MQLCGESRQLVDIAGQWFAYSLMDIQEVGVGLDIKYIRMIYAIGGTYLERIQHCPSSYHIYSAPVFGKRSAVP